MKVDKGLKDISDYMLTRVNNDFDCVVAVTGDEGVGKSSLAMWLAMLTDKKFSVKDSVVFSPKTQDAISQVKKLHRYGSIVMDEGIKMAYKLNWQNKVQQLLNMVYTLNRAENKMTIICIPQFTDLNTFFRKHRVYFWIHVYARGRAVVFKKIPNPYGQDPWMLDKNHKKILLAFLKKGHNYDAYDVLQMLRSNPTFFHEFSFPDMPEEFKEEYNRLKEEYRYDGMELSQERSAVIEDRNKLIIKLREFINVKEIASLVSVGERTIFHVLKNENENVSNCNNTLLNKEIGILTRK